MLNRFAQDESGATAVEYGLIAALIAIALISGATAVGDRVTDTFDTTAGVLKNAEPGTVANGL